MPDPNKKKQEYYLSVKEMAGKLRVLADELERGVVTINEQELSIAPDTQVKISQKTKSDTFSSKLKLKLTNSFTETVEGEVKSTSYTGSDIENYKVLKKRMAKDFKAIKKSCMQEQAIPGAELIERFYRDSKTMCSYSDKGEEFYDTFARQSGFFYEAFESSDLEAMSAAVTALGQTRNDCHDKYK
ncbi:MAG: GAK system XXXCH domain-containing protein [Candidatus Brocadiaceae bacterium]|nr:GAK system XXXCH domain-containing protein [Candidatus Brocadiaceae bacterium]